MSPRTERHKAITGPHGRTRAIVGRLIVVAWAMLFVYGSQGNYGGSAADENAGIPGKHEVHLEYVNLKEYEGHEWDAWKEAGVEKSIMHALSDAGEVFKYARTGPVVWDQNAHLEDIEIDGFYALHKYKPEANYPYFLISTRTFSINGHYSDVDGFTPVLNSPGFDGLFSHNLSILVYDNIKASAQVADNEGMWGAVAIHEIGHQRASLVHVETNPSLHRCCAQTENTEGYKCVMHLFQGLSFAQIDDILGHHEFCGDKSDYTDPVQTESCIKYLYARGERE